MWGVLPMVEICEHKKKHPVLIHLKVKQFQLVDIYFSEFLYYIKLYPLQFR